MVPGLYASYWFRPVIWSLVFSHGKLHKSVEDGKRRWSRNWGGYLVLALPCLIPLWVFV